MKNSSEWHNSDSYPPLGERCEYKLHPFEGGWITVKVVLYTDQVAILEDASGKEFAIPKVGPSRYFRPLNEERNLLIKRLTKDIGSNKKPEDIAALLIDQGWRPSGQ